MFANFFLQCVIANAAKDKDMHEQDLIVANLKRDLSNRALSRYSCRVVQKAVEVSSGRQTWEFSTAKLTGIIYRLKHMGSKSP